MSAPENIGALLPLVARANAIAGLGGGRDAGEAWLRAKRVGERGLRMFTKASVPASVTGDDFETQAAVGAYTETLRASSAAVRLVLDRIVRRVPFYERQVLITTSPTAAVPGEGQAGPVSRIVFSGETIQPATAMAIIVPTKEMVQALGSDAETLFNNELSALLGEKLDAEFFAALVGDATDAPVITSSGPRAAHALYDLRRMLLTTNAIGNARLAFVMGKDAIKRAASLGGEDGIPIFQDLSPTGGTMLNVPAMLSSGIGADEVYLVEGSCIAANLGPVEVRPGPSVSLEMADPTTHDAITPTPTSLVSAFQNNLLPFRATIVYGAVKLRDNAIVKLEGIEWGSVAP